MKKIYKIISVIVIIITIINIANVSRASLAKKSITVTINWSGNVQYSYNGEDKRTVTRQTDTGIPVYAMSKNNESIQFNSTNVEVYKNEEIKNILKNGYGCKTMSQIGCANPVEAFLATQEAIYIYNEKRNVEDYVIDEGKTARLLEVAQMIIETASKEPKELLEIQQNSKGWKEVKQDKDYKYKEYSINSTNEEIGFIELVKGNDVKIIDINTKIEKREFNNGDKFYLIVPKNMKQEVEIKFSYEKDGILLYKANIGDELKDQFIFAEHGKELIEKNINIDVEGNAKIKIVNKDSTTSEPIVGSIFSIIKENNSIVKENLVTDEKGEINIFLDNGKYYLKQISSVGEYCKNKSLIEINVDDDTKEAIMNINGVKATTEESTNINKEINVTEEIKNITHNNIKEISNITTTNINKEIINQTNETNLHNINNFINNINRKNVLNLKKENTYNNYIEERETIRNEVLTGDNEEVIMSRQDYINYMDMVMLDSAKVPILPVASK